MVLHLRVNRAYYTLLSNPNIITYHIVADECLA
jgi:hypothetical protein